MNKEIRIFTADSSTDFQAILSSIIEQQEGMRIQGSATDGKTALELVQKLKPDVLVTELLLREIDGVGLIRQLKESGNLPPTIVVSGFYNDGVAAELSKLGVIYYFPKPCRVEDLLMRIQQASTIDLERRQSADSSRYDAEITEILLNIGIMPHLQGFKFLREAIKRTADDKSVLRGVTKILYPDLAKYFQTTPECIERSMRNALSSAWHNSDEERRKIYFGKYSVMMKSRPTNSRFILMISDYVIDQKERERRFR